MSEFELDGFLSERPSAMEADIARAHGGLFSLARQINRDCHELVWGAKIHSQDNQEILVAALFLRALEHYQRTILLLGIGLVSSSEALSAPRLKRFSLHARSLGAMRTFEHSSTTTS